MEININVLNVKKHLNHIKQLEGIDQELILINLKFTNLKLQKERNENMS